MSHRTGARLSYSTPTASSSNHRPPAPVSLLPTKPKPPIYQESFAATAAPGDKKGEWLLVARVKLPDSHQSGDSKALSESEMHIVLSLNAADRYMFNNNSSTSTTTVSREDCKHCSVQTKIVRGNGTLSKFQRGHHNHLPPSGNSNNTSSSHQAFNMRAAGYGQSNQPSRVRPRPPSPPGSAPVPKRAAKSLNHDLHLALLDYAQRLVSFNSANGIDGPAARVPNLVRKSAKEVNRVRATQYVAFQFVQGNVQSHE